MSLTNILKLFSLTITLMATMTSNAQVYKWVDENGTTHFSSQRPAHDKYQDIDISVSPKRQASKEVQEFAESLQQAVLTDHGDAQQLDCSAAVVNSKDQLSSMQAVSLKNLQDGYLSQADYDQAKVAISGAKNQISTQECLSATGPVKKFYLCMSNQMNHVMRCGKKYDYGA
ncbi:DUF4124 domain-containing protein [Agarivorans sp. MS3-6]|uniref:DUF4124 domain-containing protein n=1 Tax=Agarivorans sp. TSD2052 TaxID=2937286 RepID=UPI00200FDC43|nr:DUF4124 domain-containing protein [Agarivorans sp. TSD2052]UPW19958.1 DUF4124 domain-containing protein [Agarivorans sp. TSD2052]